MTVQGNPVGERTGEGGQPPVEPTQNGEPTVEQLRAENARLAQQNGELLRMKSNAEATNRTNEELNRKMAELQSQLGALTTQEPRRAGQDDIGEIVRRGQQRMVATFQGSEDAAEREVAAYVTFLGDQVMNLSQELARTRGLLRTPEQERADVERIQQEAAKRGEIIGPETARRLLELERKAQAPAPEVRQSVREPEPVITNVQPAPVQATQAKRPTTVAEYGAMMRALEADGNDTGRDELMSWRRNNPGALKS